MNITTHKNIIHISGDVKSINDFEKIQLLLDQQTKKYKSIKVFMIDSLSITSSVIGYFNKLVQGDGVNLELFVSNQQLLDLLGDLKLIDLFNAKTIKKGNFEEIV